MPYLRQNKKKILINIEKNGPIAGPEMELCQRQCTVCPNANYHTTTSTISSCLRPQGLQISPPYRLYYNISPSYSSSVYSRGEYNTLKWRSKSIVYGNSLHNRRKVSTLKISAEACSLIFLLWEIICKKMPPYLLRNRHA